MKLNPFNGNRKERLEKVQKVVNQHLIQCPICNHTETQELVIMAGGSLTLYRLGKINLLSSLPYITLQCTQCGFVMLFAET